MGSRQGLTPGTQAALDRLLAADDHRGAARLADDLAADGDLGGARRVLAAAIEAWPTDLGLAIRQLELFVRYKRFRDFNRAYADLVRRHPRERALLRIGARGAEMQRDFDAALRAYHALSKLDPKDPEPVVRGSRALRALDRPYDAIRWVHASLKRVGDDAGLYAALGYAWIQRGEPDRAVGCFRRAHRMQPDWGPYLDDLAGALMLGERWAEAARVAKRSLDLRSKNERAWTVYAIAHDNLGDARRAERGHVNAMRAARDPSRAAGNFGLFLMRRGRATDARAYLEQAAEAHPEWDEVVEALDA